MSLLGWAERVLKRRSWYRATFQTQAGLKTLAELRQFTRFGESPLVVSTVRQQVDPIATAVRIGRQEVFQHILAHIHVDDAQLLKMKDQIHDDE